MTHPSNLSTHASGNVSDQSILVIRFGAMGDLLHVSASIAALKEAYPDMTIHFLTSPLYQDLVKAFKGVDQVWTFDKKTGLVGLLRFTQALKTVSPRFDALINLHPNLRTYLMTAVLNPPKLAVYRKEKLKTLGLETRDRVRRHAMDDFYVPFQKIWPDLPALSMPVLSLPASSLQNKTHIEEQSDFTLGIVPGVGGKRGNRSWSVEYYKNLMKVLLEDESGFGQVCIRLFGGPDEVALCEQLEPKGQIKNARIENHCAQFSILETAQEMQRCDVVLAGDTGPLHLAAATGVEVIGLFGPTSPNRTGPRGVGSCQSLTPDETLTCWPCEKPICPLSDEMTDACMKSISPAAVLAQLKIVHEKIKCERLSN